MNKRKANRNRAIGIIATVVLLGLAYYLVDQKEVLSDSRHYYGYYKNVAGLGIGTPVMIKGVQVGKVDNMELMQGDGIKVDLAIHRDVKIPRGSVMWLVPGGINGGQGIDIVLGKGPGMTAQGGILETRRDTGIVDNLNYKTGFYVRSGRELLKAFDTSVRKFNYVLSSGLLRDIMNGVYYLNKQTGKFEARSGELKGYTFKMDNGLLEIDTTLASLASKNSQLNNKIYQADTTMAGFAQKNFKRDIDTLRENIKSIGASIGKLKDNKLLKDKNAYTRSNNSADSANRKLKDIKEHPSAHWMSIFGKNKKK